MDEMLEMLIEDSAQKVADSKKDESPEERIQRYARYLSENGYKVLDAASEAAKTKSDGFIPPPVTTTQLNRPVTTPVDVDMNFRVPDYDKRDHGYMDSMIRHIQDSLAYEVGRKVLSESNFYHFRLDKDRSYDYGSTTLRIKLGIDLAADPADAGRNDTSANYGKRYADTVPFENILSKTIGDSLRPSKSKYSNYYPTIDSPSKDDVSMSSMSKYMQTYDKILKNPIPWYNDTGV